MRQMVTRGFYDRSRIGLWLFEVIGREYDGMADWARNLRLEAFVQTCTWSIHIWEWVYGIEPDDALPLEVRRGRILIKKLERPPINPARIEEILSTLTGVPVAVVENIAPYTFKVELDESASLAVNFSEMFALLRKIKPSHMAFRVHSRIKIGYTATDCVATYAGDYVRDFYSEEIPIPAHATAYTAHAGYDTIREAYTSND